MAERDERREDGFRGFFLTRETGTERRVSFVLRWGVLVVDDAGVMRVCDVSCAEDERALLFEGRTFFDGGGRSPATSFSSFFRPLVFNQLIMTCIPILHPYVAPRARATPP